MYMYEEITNKVSQYLSIYNVHVIQEYALVLPPEAFATQSCM